MWLLVMGLIFLLFALGVLIYVKHDEKKQEHA